MAGRFAEAEAAAPTAAIRAWVRLGSRDWRAPVAAAPPAREPAWEGLTAVETLEVGLVAARAAWPGGDTAMLTLAHAAADALHQRGSTEADLLESCVHAAIAAAQEEREVLALAIAQAAGLERRLTDAGTPLPDSFSVARLAGDLWLQVHRYADARDAYGLSIARDRRDARAWLGLGRTLAKLDLRDASIDAYRTFLELWGGADEGRSELIEARHTVAAGGPAGPP